MKYLLIILITLILLTIYPQQLQQEKFQNRLPENKNKIKYGIASYYDYTIGDWSSVGHYVCATRDFIRYSYVRVTNIINDKAVEVCVTDYGPCEAIHPNRIIDLSSTAFNTISSAKLGIADVKVEQLNKKCR